MEERSTSTRSEIDIDAQPLYELHSGTSRAHTPFDEEGLARRIAEIAQFIDEPVWNKEGQLDHTYGVLSHIGQPIAVIGILRPRFRVRNPHNAGVSDAWKRIRESNACALEMVNSVRSSLNLDLIPAFLQNDVGVSRSFSEDVAHIPINTDQSLTNKDQSLKREKRKRTKVRKVLEFDWERELRNAI